MSRLYRPHIPLKIRVVVAERQLRELDPSVYGYVIPGKKTAGNRLLVLLPWLAKTFGCDVSELRLDHDPPLGARDEVRRHKSKKTQYIPDANDPDHLFYRPHGPEHTGSHLIKTNVRGDHGQHPDRVLIKKARRLERNPKPKRGRKIGSPGFYSRDTKPKWPKRSFSRSKR
jgi:hypothetical protein